MTKSDRPRDAWIDELEHDLGQPAALRLLANAGGQRRDIPKRAAGSNLAAEVGEDIVTWLAARFGGTSVDIPSHMARKRQDKAARLRADILDAGLTNPTRSANVIAMEHGVTAAYVHKLRTQMRRENGESPQPLLPGF